MADKRKLDDLLSQDTPKPVIRRGQGIRLSTDTRQNEPSDEEPIESAHVHKSTSAEEHIQPLVKRVSQGQRLRADLLKAMKRIAVEDERKFYEVMEEAMEQYIERRKENSA